MNFSFFVIFDLGLVLLLFFNFLNVGSVFVSMGGGIGHACRRFVGTFRVSLFENCLEKTVEEIVDCE